MASNEYINQLLQRYENAQTAEEKQFIAAEIDRIRGIDAGVFSPPDKKDAQAAGVSPPVIPVVPPTSTPPPPPPMDMVPLNVPEKGQEQEYAPGFFPQKTVDEYKKKVQEYAGTGDIESILKMFGVGLGGQQVQTGAPSPAPGAPQATPVVRQVETHGSSITKGIPEDPRYRAGVEGATKAEQEALRQRGEAKARGAEQGAEITRDVQQGLTAKYQEHEDRMNALRKELDNRKKEFDKALQKFESTKINPDRFWTSKEPWQRALIMLGTALASASALDKGSAMASLNKMIDRDLAAQKMELDKMRQGLAFKQNAMTFLFQEFNNERLAYEQTRRALLDDLALRLKEVGLKTDSEVERRNAEILIQQLEKQKLTLLEQSRIRSIDRKTFTYQKQTQIVQGAPGVKPLPVGAVEKVANARSLNEEIDKAVQSLRKVGNVGYSVEKFIPGTQAREVLQTMLNTMLSVLARSKGEKGTLSDKDIERWTSALNPRFITAKGMIERLQRLRAENNARGRVYIQGLIQGGHPIAQNYLKDFQ